VIFRLMYSPLCGFLDIAFNGPPQHQAPPQEGSLSGFTNSAVTFFYRKPLLWHFTPRCQFPRRSLMAKDRFPGGALFGYARHFRLTEQDDFPLLHPTCQSINFLNTWVASQALNRVLKFCRLEPFLGFPSLFYPRVSTRYVMQWTSGHSLDCPVPCSFLREQTTHAPYAHPLSPL